ncbi:MAG: hypothetical protein RML10_07695 [Geminocystis sp.]|nr:hypothetical protein [Geminocystis sp.]MDW8463462.1 hypothetical protein [Geminocystis sp.]
MRFSSFLFLKKLKGKQLPDTCWQIEPSLERNIRLLLDRGLERNEEVIATNLLPFLRQQEDKLREKHLTAYLQECCFFASKNVYRRLEGYSNSPTWEDYFQWGKSLATSPRGTKLANYGRYKIIESQLVDEAYRHLSWKKPYHGGLLKQFKPTSRRKCLEIIGGYGGETLQQYLPVWECFCLIYSPSVTEENQTPPPPPFLAIKYHLPLPSLDARVCERIIKTYINCVRNYCNPKTFPLKSLDITSKDNQWEEVYAPQDYETINGVIQSAYGDLNPCRKIISPLRLSLQLPQKTIARILSTNYSNSIREQHQVSWEIAAARKFILERLIRALKQPLKNEWLTIPCRQILLQRLYPVKYFFFQFLNSKFSVYRWDLPPPINSLF